MTCVSLNITDFLGLLMCQAIIYTNVIYVWVNFCLHYKAFISNIQFCDIHF